VGVGFRTDWLGFGAVVGCGVVGVTFGVAEAVAVDAKDLALITTDVVDGALVDVPPTGVAAGRNTWVVGTADVRATLEVRVWVVCEVLAEGFHAGSSVALNDRSGSPAAGLAVGPVTVTAPTDCGPSNNWNTPMMPVRMNIVMSHNFQRCALAPIATAILSRAVGSRAVRSYSRARQVRPRSDGGPADPRRHLVEASLVELLGAAADVVRMDPYDPVDPRL
jgi:hypothetical protein